MKNKNTLQAEKAKLLFSLHHNGNLLVLPNIWDPLGALLLEKLGYPAIATASASIAFSNGYPDGEKIPLKELLPILRKITGSVSIPVTADIETGFAKNNAELKQNIKKLLDTGIVGINLEDTRLDDDTLISTVAQCEKISLVRDTASEMGIPLFINARTDVYLKAKDLTEEEKLRETIRRGKAYKDSGADGFYPIFLKKKEAIEAIIDEVRIPVNILLLPGIPDFKTLRSMGVARLSLGPGYLKIALNAMKNTAERLLHDEGMQEVMDNPVSTAYINTLLSP